MFSPLWLLRRFLDALPTRRPAVVLVGVRPIAEPPALPPDARTAMPDSSGPEAVTYNRTRKATAIALHLLRHEHLNAALVPFQPQEQANAVIDEAAARLGWKEVSPETRAAVHAALGVLLADPAVVRCPAPLP